MSLGLCAMIVTGIVGQLVTGSDQTTLVFMIVMVVGEGIPFALLFLGASFYVVQWAWRSWPLRRVTESSPDLRQIYRSRD